MSRSPILILFVSILLGACLPSPPSSATSERADPTASPTATEASTPSPASDTITDSDPASCPPIGGELLGQMRMIEAQTSQLRGMQSLRPVERALLTDDQIRSKVVAEFLADYSEGEAEADSQLLYLLGLLPADLDLRQLYTDLLSEQIAGYYDTEAEEMVVVCDGAFDGVERLTYAHEFLHALQDQRHDFETQLAYSDAACEGSSQRCAAILALLEGEATLLQEQWLRTFATEQDYQDLADYFSSFAMPVYESAPAFIQADFTFPYLAGLSFVRSLYLDDGWTSVDEAFLNPPQSTEQILHPERYPWDEVVFLEAPDLLSLSENGWETAYQDVLGEWTLLKLLETYLPADVASSAAEGWGGDVAILLDNPDLDEQAALVVVQWDSMRDAHEFTSSFKAYGEVRLGEASQSTTTSATWATSETTVLIERHSNQALILITPTAQYQLIRDAVLLPVRAKP